VPMDLLEKGISNSFNSELSGLNSKFEYNVEIQSGGQGCADDEHRGCYASQIF